MQSDIEHLYKSADNTKVKVSSFFALLGQTKNNIYGGTRTKTISEDKLAVGLGT